MNFRLAYRYLLRTPGFAIFSILELALGIGLTTTAFFVVDAVLLRPLDIPHPEQLVQVQPLNKKSGKANNTAPAPDFRDLRDRADAFQSIAAYYPDKTTILLGNRAEQATIVAVSRGWHETIGIQPVLGTGLFANTKQETGALISYGFWQSKLAGDAEVLRRTLQVHGTIYNIRGVMPDRGIFPEGTEIWIPIVPEDDSPSRTAFNYRLLGRLKASSDLARGKANLAAVAAGLEREFPENINRSYTATDLRERMVGSYRDMLMELSYAVGAILLIVCANVTNLLLARAVQRKRELAIRMALGARARNLFSAVLSESLLISLTGGALGLLLAVWLRDLLLNLNPFPIPRLALASMDQTVVAFTVFASVFCGTVTGLLPAWRVWRSGVQTALGSSPTRAIAGAADWQRSYLLVAEVALSFVLLAGAGHLLRSFARLSSVDPGFRAENLQVMECDLTALGSQNVSRTSAFYDELRNRALTLPGVTSAAWNRDLPATESGQWGTVFLEGRPKPAPSEFVRFSAEWHLAGPDFFRTIGAPILLGRDLSPADSGSAPEVALVNAAFLRLFFPNGEDPIGHRFQIGLDREMKPITIVGVAGDIRTLAQPARPQLYLPYLQHLSASGQLYLTVRSSGPPAPLIDALRRSAAASMPEAVVHFTTMKGAVAETVAPWRFRALVLAFFSAIALVLALTGLYAVCSYAAQARTREIGVRMALGARSSAVLWQLVTQALRWTLVGEAIGIVAAFFLGKSLASSGISISSADWLTCLGTCLLLAAGSVAASLTPAWRASRVDPSVVLREE